MTYNDKPIEYLNHYPNALPPGTELKDVYKVMDVLGQGSFGITYLAVTQDGQQFAVKEFFHKRMCYRSGLDVKFSEDAEVVKEVTDGLKDFSNEAANLTRIYTENQRLAELARSQGRHDLLAEENYNIVRVVESFKANQTSYLVMEYLDGGNLLQMLKKPMPEEMATSIIISIAWAVQHLHDNHIMHKDIKPENIMMRSGNLMEPKLIDFGATLHYDRSGKLTTRSIGTALWTDNYCSLEHSANSRLTPHLDVYSLGATLFHMVTGAPREPWGDHPQPDVVINNVKTSLQNAKVSERVSQAILQAMDNDPNTRTQTAREFIENLNSPYLPLGAVLESPNGNRYRIISVEGQEKDYLSYKAERLLKDTPAGVSGTVPIDKVSDGFIYTVHENFAKGVCHRGENQYVTSNRGHWPKQDYLVHVKENTGLVKIPSISTDKQGNPLAEVFTANGTIYCIKQKKTGMARLFSSEKTASKGTKLTAKSNNKHLPLNLNKRKMKRIAMILGLVLLLFGCGSGIWWLLQPNYYIEFGDNVEKSYVFGLKGGTLKIPIDTDAPFDKWDILILDPSDTIDWVTVKKVDGNYIEIHCDEWKLPPRNRMEKESQPDRRKIMFCLMADSGVHDWTYSECIHILQSENSDEVTVLPEPIQKLLDDMVYVEGGSFMMGIDAAHAADEEIDGYLMSIGFPAHNVTLSNFFICKYEVTQELWEAVMGETHSRYKVGGPDYPVDFVSWDDCQEFISKLNAITGLKYRLPTEAEWEFAARGGNKGQGYSFSGSDSPNDVAVYGRQWDSPSGNPYLPVGSMKSNELKLYDMSGNVTEWCQDWFGLYGFDDESNPQGPKSGKERVIRTGGVDPILGPDNSVADRRKETETAKEGGLRLAHDADVRIALARAPEAPAEAPSE